MEALKAGLGKLVPEAIECLEAGLEASAVFYDFPEARWRRIRSTNGLERLHGEIKRRILAVGSFPDRASALRLISSVALRVTSIWTDRRYLDMTAFEKQEARAASSNGSSLGLLRTTHTSGLDRSTTPWGQRH